MAVNSDKPNLWKADIAASVDMYNEWFIEFAPKAFRDTRIKTTEDVESALGITGAFANITEKVLREHPEILPTLRMSTCPPLAVDRLIGLSGVHPGIVKSMEQRKKMPPRSANNALNGDLEKIAGTILRLLDKDVFPWLENGNRPTSTDIRRAATIVADRLCGSVANPIIRNAQEQRQLETLRGWLENKGYALIQPGELTSFHSMPERSFGFRVNVPATVDGISKVIIPVDALVMTKNREGGKTPLFIEAKSAGDYTNVNKRRKEEAIKVTQLRKAYGPDVRFVLFLCGYFDSGYLGYEAAEGIDWAWEHRIDDLSLFGV